MSSPATISYADRCEIRQASVTGSAPFTRNFASTRDGLLIARQESTGVVENYIYSQGKTLANVGNAVAPQIIDTIDPITTDYPDRTPTSYVINNGDTLQSIAQSV